MEKGGAALEVLVLVDFDGQLADELKITAGDVIHQVQPGPEEGWLQGELEGRVGLFPQQFVQEIPASLRADGTQRYPRSLRSAQAVKKLPAVKPRWCRVTFPYVPAKEDELELCSGELVQILEEIEDGWWLGRKNGQLGAFPSNFVQELSSQPPDIIFTEPKGGAVKQRPRMTEETFLSGPEKLENAAEKPVPQVPARPMVQAVQTSAGDASHYCRAMFDYEPEHEDELLLRRGDLVLLLSKETVDVGWWEGENRGRRGLFPDNFAMPLSHIEPGIKTKVPARSEDSATKLGKKVLQGSKVEMRHPGDHKDSKEQKKMDAPKLNPPPVKRAAPCPPAPAKAKPVPNLPPKSASIPVACTATPVGREKCKEAGADRFHTVPVPSAKLNHPTANRPKMPGKRPPSQLMASSPVEKPTIPAREDSPTPVCDVPRMEEHLESLEDLKTELRSLRTLMDLMRAQHRRDMEEMKVEMSQEQTKRAALQAEIEWLKRTVPTVPASLGRACPVPTPGGGAVEGAGLGVFSSNSLHDLCQGPK